MKRILRGGVEVKERGEERGGKLLFIQGKGGEE